MEVIHTNEDARLHCQIDPFLWGAGSEKLLFNLRVTVCPMAEEIQCVQQGYQGLVHIASAGRFQRYSGNGKHST